MNISAASARSGVAQRTLRYYESIGLIRPQRRANGYRDYSDADVQRLRLVARARGLGFSIEECRALLSLYDDRGRASADVRRLAETHLAGIDHKIAALHAMRDTLSSLIAACAGDERPDCPILTGLAGDGVSAAAAEDPETPRSPRVRAIRT